MEPSDVLAGIFVGGMARRFNGVPKGLLEAPDGTGPVIERLIRQARHAWTSPRIVLVGGNPAYTHLGFPTLLDDPPETGPLGGLRALLLEAERDDRNAVALACDLPYLNASLLAKLPPNAANVDAVAPRPLGIWQPLCAWYAPACRHAIDHVLQQGRRALHAVLDELGERASELQLDAAEEAQLHDWDEPSDLVGSRTSRRHR